MHRRSMLSAFATSASAATLAVGLAAMPAAAQAQDAQVGEPSADEIIVTGVRASLERSIGLKRNSYGVVDGISAEDIGKFPDTNVAESLQRITGVSIDRVNGEGSKVTVRGFGPGFNLVTLNGRTLPTTSIAVVGQDQGGDTANGTDRSFDFSNLAAEGVKTLEVYKTSRAAIPSGGIGATINVATRRPLDGEAGFSGSVGAKAAYDGSKSSYGRLTPEASGVLNWANEDGTFGVGLFASYQNRHSSAPSLTVNDWNIEPFSSFADPANGRVKSDGSTVINNAPDADTLVAFPNDTRYEYSEFKRERLNGQLTLQFRPSDTLELTVDGTFYQNKASEERTDQTNWYNRPFSEVTFDGNKKVATAVELVDTITGVKDGGFEQQYRATKDRLWDIGANARWEASDRLTLTFDGHYGKGESLPDNPLGHTSTMVSIADKAVAGQTLTIVNGFPQQSIVFNDDPDNGGNGNGNGVLDLADLGSQVARSATAFQKQKVGELRFDGAWDLGDDDRVEFGANFRQSNMREGGYTTYQALGDWGVGNVGDIEQYAGNLVKSFCLTCKFDHFDPGSTGASKVAFRGDATDLWTALTPHYPGANTINGSHDNRIKETVWAAYAQIDINTELAGRPAQVIAGIRYEHTSLTATSLVSVPTAIRWDADNDFTQVVGADVDPLSEKHSYDNFLPALDFSIDITDTLKGRASFGRTLSRPAFGNLFSAASVNPPGRPTAIGGIPGGRSGNPNLQPLISDNIDVSLEWYFQRSSYLSLGLFDKRVKNFVGTGQETYNLFGLRDPSSGESGTRSGDALEYLRSINADISDVNLFTMTALIDQMGLAQAQQTFQTHFQNGALDQAFIDDVLKAYNVTANGEDPLMQFQVQKPVNNKEGHIYGLEIAGQYFFGDTGFGVAAAYTLVNGNVGYDITADPSTDQFALLGLSDTANVTGIFEKYGLSARIAYNWRAKYLANNSRGGYRNPVFVAPYGQLDLNVSYDITPEISVSFEAINLTKEDTRMYARTRNQPWFIVEGNSRYLLGARYRF